MWTLAVETSTEQGSIAVLKDLTVVSLKEWRREKSHSEFVTSKIQEALKDSGTSVASLDRIGVGCGPGSFTGIRVAVNAAKTLSFSLGKKIFATNTFRILAEPTQLQNLPVLGLINAHKNLIYASALKFDGQKFSYLFPPDAISVEELENRIKSPHLCLGSGYEGWKETFSQALRDHLVRDPSFSDDPSAAHLGRMTAEAPEKELMSWNEVQPLYIRASEPEEKLRAGLFTDRSRINE